MDTILIKLLYFYHVHVLQQPGVADGVYVVIAFPGIGHDGFDGLSSRVAKVSCQVG